MFKNVLVPVDFSEASAHAVRLARGLGERVTLMHVGLAPELYYGDLAAYGFAVPETAKSVREEVQRESTKALERLRADEAPGAQILVREGYAPDEICAEAARGYDLVVMGTHGRTGIKRALLGSVTERVLRHCKVPILVTR
ncbi:MAG: universal stress protein [Myxococcota bacterium]